MRLILYALVYNVKRKVISFREIWEGEKGSLNSKIIMLGSTNIILGIFILLIKLP
jgi:hypothetical protein